MHPNRTFRTTGRAENLAFSQARGFGILAVNSETGPLISHIPFVLSGDGALMEAHLVRSNPILKLLDAPCPAVMAVSGGDAYVSPDWYGVENQVPTWNYVAVHLRGPLRRLAQTELAGILDKLSAEMEGRLLPKTPWTTAKMDPDIYVKMQSLIVPIAMDITEVQGTWKLSQNKAAGLRRGATEGIRAAGVGAGTQELARLMSELPD